VSVVDGRLPQGPSPPTEGGRGTPLWIGITGNIACGKSAVLAMLGEAGAATIDADGAYASLVVPGSPLLDRIASEFGRSVMTTDGALDRRALAGIVFSDPAALASLDRIVRPPVVSEILRRAEAAGSEIVAIDAIKLIESGLADRCNEVWVVRCGPETQLARLMARNGLDPEGARKRISAQPPVAMKLARADRTIDNDGPIADTRIQVGTALEAAIREHKLRHEPQQSAVAEPRKG
jgi:dephospho-CoA kinase